MQTDLAYKSFVKYAERFRTLGRITEYKDKLLIDKLNNIMEKNMCIALIGYKSHEQVPKEWGNYLDILLAIYKKSIQKKSKVISSQRRNICQLL